MLSYSSAAALASASFPWLGVSSRQLLIVAGGGRELSWSSTRIASALLSHSQGRSVLRLLHGGARGADTAIGGACERLGWSVEILHPQWSRYGRAAGPLRNRQLLQRACQLATTAPWPGHPPLAVLVLAFPGGRGTASLVAQARQLQRRSAVSIELAQVLP